VITRFLTFPSRCLTKVCYQKGVDFDQYQELIKSFEDTSWSGRKSDHLAYPISKILWEGIVSRLEDHFGHATKDLIGPVENSIVPNGADIVSS
jgi:hypothetical protein